MGGSLLKEVCQLVGMCKWLFLIGFVGGVAAGW
jgi:hypothetical protein